MADKALCKEAGCGKPAKARGWCSMHWQRWSTHGAPTGGGTHKGEPMEYLLKHMNDGCGYPWPFATAGSPRPYASLKVNGKNQPATRVVCEIAHGPPPTPDHEAAHGCGNSLCFNADCLRWATPVENNADKLVHDTHNRGTRHGQARLTEQDVRAIRSSGDGPDVLARRFGVSVKHISNIRRRRVWAWLDAEDNS